MISLSIFIPTYKRLNRLFELLMLIDLHHKESDIIKDNVEIVISSNDFNEYEKILFFSQNNQLIRYDNYPYNFLIQLHVLYVVK